MPFMRIRKSAQRLSPFQNVSMMSISTAQPLVAPRLSRKISESQSSARQAVFDICSLLRRLLPVLL